jgi:3-oxoacyl-[acyl-carrier protein] reductase
MLCPVPNARRGKQNSGTLDFVGWRTIHPIPITSCDVHGAINARRRNFIPWGLNLNSGPVNPKREMIENPGVLTAAMNIKSHKGKVALVTGGSKGIGAGIVRRLAADGAAVAFTYSSSEEKALQLVREITSEGGKVLSLKADSASEEELRAAVAKTTEALGGLDIFVSNAGILIRGPIDTYRLEDFDRMVAINVRAAFVGIQASAQDMKDGGRIVLIGSNTAIRTAFPGASVYSMTKAALTGLVRGAAIDLAPRAITVNNVQPGPTDTDMASSHAELIKPLIPLKRMGSVSEVASFVSYLASEEAGFITGASLTIDGGYVA